MEKTSPRKSLPSIHEALGEGKGLPPLTTPSHHPSLSTPTPSTTLSQQFPEGPRGPSNPFSAPSFREPPFRENPFSTQQPPSSASSDLRSKEFMSTHLPPQSPRSAVPPPFHSGPTVSANSSFTPRAEPPQPPRSPDIDSTRQNFSTMARQSVSTYRDDPYQYPSSSVGHDSRPPYNRGPEPPYDNTIKRHIGVHEAAKDLGDVSASQISVLTLSNDIHSSERSLAAMPRLLRTGRSATTRAIGPDSFKILCPILTKLRIC